MPKDRGKTTGIAIRYIEPGDGDPRHGTANGYGNLKCRCTPCRGAWADTFASYKATWKLLPGDSRHGTYNGYTNYGCRCGACKEAQNAHYQDYKRRKSDS
jgi:hypothetical protein